MKISIVIPAYNEEFRLPNSIKILLEFTAKRKEEFEIIIVDDGSKDNTVGVAKNFGNSISVISLEKNSGKGAAVRKGMMSATGDFIFFMDADLSTPIYELDKLLPHLINNEFDVALGSRAVDYSSIKIHQPFYREFMGKTFNKIVQLLVVKGIKDTQCGFKGFTKEAARSIFSKTLIDGFSFDVELVYIASKLGLKIKEISVEWYNDEQSKISPIKDSLKMLFEILEIKKLHKQKF
ncbi:MAG: hypothetical protein A2X64_09105 [Ignavibacteria bacterium GWF2_33_9]|nr:MAG: hypothetical protein A2X64_09105 [Ignavibacteria bacterium GWF2_33_9]